MRDAVCPTQNMDHRHAETGNIVDRYVSGRLSESEIEDFEAHYLTCDRCLDELELSEILEEGLPDQPQVPVAKKTQARRWRNWAIAASVLLATSVVLHLLRLQELSTERTSRQGLEEKLATILAPQANVPIFRLSRTRGENTEPSAVVQLSGEPEWLVFSIDLGPPYRDAYDVSLTSQDDLIWEMAGVAPNYDRDLVIGLHSPTLRDGSHRFQISPSGHNTIVQTYVFRVVTE